LDAASKEKGKGKGKAKAVADGAPPSPMLGDPPSKTAAGKRKRPPIDPFAGYGGGQDTGSPGAPADTSSATSRSGTKVRRIHIEDFSAEAPSGTNTPSGGEDKGKRSRKRSKKKAVS